MPTRENGRVQALCAIVSSNGSKLDPGLRRGDGVGSREGAKERAARFFTPLRAELNAPSPQSGKRLSDSFDSYRSKIRSCDKRYYNSNNHLTAHSNVSPQLLLDCKTRNPRGRYDFLERA